MTKQDAPATLQPEPELKPGPQVLTVGVSSGALFDIRSSDKVFREQGEAVYEDFMRETALEPLPKGAAWPLIEKLLRFNDKTMMRVEVVIMSRNDPSSILRIQNSMRHHGLMYDPYKYKISRYVVSHGRPRHLFLKTFNIDLFLSTNHEDVLGAIEKNIAAAVMSPPPPGAEPDSNKLHFCFDFDGVLGNEESELYFQNACKIRGTMSEAIDDFIRHEAENLAVPMGDGPYARLVRKLAAIKREFPKEILPIEISVLTARANAPLERALRTLQSWNVNPDTVIGLDSGGSPNKIEKADVLRDLRPDLFVDDGHRHIELASQVSPSGRVPWGA